MEHLAQLLHHAMKTALFPFFIYQEVTTAVCIIQGTPNFDSEIKSQSREHYITLNSASNLPFSLGPYSHKNKLVHQTNKCAKRSLQKFGVFEVLLLLVNTIPDEWLIGNA